MAGIRLYIVEPPGSTNCPPGASECCNSGLYDPDRFPSGCGDARQFPDLSSLLRWANDNREATRRVYSAAEAAAICSVAKVPGLPTPAAGGPTIQCGPGGCPQPGSGTTFTPGPGIPPVVPPIVPQGPYGPGVGGGTDGTTGETAGNLAREIKGWLTDWIGHMPESTQATLRKLPAILQGPLGILLLVCLVLWVIMHGKRS